MRTCTALAAALLTLPLALGAQRIPLPRVRPAQPQPRSEPEPTAEPVARALAYQRSRWSGEAYTMVSSMMVPTGVGTLSRYSTLGSGTHADYRVSDRSSATVDLTYSPLGGPILTTAEIGGRYKPLGLDAEIRPYLDLRGAYLRMYDVYSAPLEAGSVIDPVGNSSQFAQEARYSRGVGAVAGGGFEYTLTNTIALSTGIAAMRTNMVAFSQSGPANIATGTRFWMTSVRYLFGITYNPGHYQSTNNPR